MMASASTTRRRKGSGSLRHLDGDRWQVVGRIDGHQVTRVFTAPNGTEAEKLAPSIRAAAIADHNAKHGGQDAGRAERQRWTVEQYAARQEAHGRGHGDGHCEDASGPRC